MKKAKIGIKAILKGDVRAVARLMREIDEQTPLARKTVQTLFPHTGKAYRVGITGPPGVGKSTLVDRLIAVFRKNEMTVGVLAVDPTSPVSGGAILGDRIRMQRHATDSGVFIRSLASRGHVGGLSHSAYAMVSVLDAIGKEIILVETVGVGQDAVEIANLVDTNLLVTIPGLGDGIQAIKAGILETAAILVVNKADLEGADRTVADLKALFSVSASSQEEWRPMVLKTEAVNNQGIDALVVAMFEHREYIKTHPSTDSRMKGIKAIFFNALRQELFQEAVARLEKSKKLDALLEALVARKTDPFTAAKQVAATFFDTPED